MHVYMSICDGHKEILRSHLLGGVMLKTPQQH